VAPSGDDAPDPVEVPVPAAPAGGSDAAYEGPLAPADPAIEGRLDPAVVLEIRQAKGAFDAAKNSLQVSAAWRRAVALAPRLEESLQPAYEVADLEPLDLSWLKPSLPAMTETYMAEGTAVVFVLDPTAWQAKAATTPEPDDDAFFALMQRAWGSARPTGWAAWDNRTWDYGGCSGLGRGTIHDVLVLTDKAAGPHFAAEVAETRAQALAAVLQDNPQFPRCDADTMGPTSTEALRGEARSILADVKLTAAERAAVEQRIPALVGQEHTGG
jgi:hypothetical protein